MKPPKLTNYELLKRPKTNRADISRQIATENSIGAANSF